MYADVIIDISHEQLDKTFQYAVPDELVDVIELGMSVDIPFGAGNRQITGYVVGLGDKAAYPVEKIKYITGITEGKVTAVSRMLKLAAWLKHNYGCTMNQAIKTVIPVKDKVKQKEKRSVNLIIDTAQAQKYLDAFAKKNAKARYRLLEALIKEPVIDESIIKSKLNITAQTVKAFEDMGIAEVRSEDMYRNPVRNVLGERKHIELNKQQKKAVDTIIADYDNGDYKTYLLHGVTGSGKTEVYLETIEHVLNHGRQAIVLIPEIALTFQTVQRFYHRFGDKVSIMNSRMSKGERYDQFLRAQRGDISVMIGPRSALFTPFSNIGLIVIDEEHEGAYKSETVPRYHAREVACHIAKEAGASVILGSATPSMESYYAAMNGHIQLITPDDITFGSNKKVWRKGTCGHEWQTSVKARSNGEKCPICSGARVIAGINDLATTDSQLLSELDYEQNKLKPTEVSRTSAKRAWWKCRHGHSWSTKINERTILNKGCRICEQEYLLLFPALVVSYYSNRKGLKAELGSDRLLGVPLETYIPSEKLGNIPSIDYS